MSTITRDDPAALGLSGMAYGSHASVKTTPTSRLWYYAIGAVALLALVAGLPNRGVNELVQLERLAPRIEKTHALSGEARDAINLLVTRQRAFLGSGSPSLNTRRSAAIERITSALNSSQSAFLRQNDEGARGN